MLREVLGVLTRRPSGPNVDSEKRREVKDHLALEVLVLEAGLEQQQRELQRPRLEQRELEELQGT